MRLPWQRRIKHPYCSRCGRQMVESFMTLKDYFNPRTGENIVTKQPWWICSWAISFTDFRHDKFKTGGPRTTITPKEGNTAK